MTKKALKISQGAVSLFIFFSAKSEYLKKIVNSTFLTVFFIFLKITGVLFMSEDMHVFFL